MGSLTGWIFIINVVCLVICNGILFKEKGNLRSSKLGYPCFLTLKLAMVLPIVFIFVVLFTFTYGFVQIVGDKMFYMVFYYYIPYSLLLGAFMILQEHQWKMPMFLMIVVLFFHGYIGHIITTKKYLFLMAGDANINIYRYGNFIGTASAYYGVIFGLLALVSLLHYRKRRFY